MPAAVYGPGSQVDITDETTRELGVVTVKNQVSTAGLAADTSLQTVIARLDSLIAATDDGTTATILGVLKDVLTQVSNHNVAITNLPTSQTVDGTVGVNNFPANQTVTVSNAETGLAKEATLGKVLAQLDDATTDTVISVLKEILAESKTGDNVNVTNFPLTYPLTDAQVTALKTVTVSNPTADPETGLAKEVTLAALKDEVDALEESVGATTDLSTAETLIGLTKAIKANTASIESLITTVRDEQFRRTDPLAAGTNHIGTVQIDPNSSSFTSSGWSKKVNEGKAYIAGGAISAGTSQVASACLTNPAGSGKNIVIAGWQIGTDQTCEVKYMHEATSTGTLRSAFNFNHYYEAVAAVATVRLGADVLTGGTELSPVGRITNNAPVGYDFMVVVQPGHSFALTAATPGLTAFTLYPTVFWYEEAI